MYRSEIETRLRERQTDEGYLFPAYEDYCFGNVPGTLRSVLDAGGERPLPADVFEGVDTDVERVVLVLVDGYGLDSWTRDRADHPFLDRLTERGTVTPLTSVYPSETAAAITTLETGRLPCEHGRIGWNVYEPRTDESFLTFGGEVKAGGQVGSVAEGAEPGPAFHYSAMADAGVDCHRLTPFGDETDGVQTRTDTSVHGHLRPWSDLLSSEPSPAAPKWSSSC